jgi:glycosyltransferase involved in cell wall biosynthesis
MRAAPHGDGTRLSMEAGVAHHALRRLLIVTPNFWPETFRINEVAEVLVGLGVSVTVLTGQPNYPEGTAYPGYRAAGMGWSTTPFGVEVARVPVITRGRGGAVRLAASYTAFLASVGALGPALLRGRRFDAILFYGVSPMVPALAGLWLRWIKDAPFALWVQDLWPGNISAAGFRTGRLIDRLLRGMVRSVYRRSDAVLVVSRAFTEDIVAIAGRDVACVYQPNPAELAVMDGPRAPPPAPGDDLFEVVFAGNLGRAVGLRTLLGAASLCLPDPSIRFRVVGAGSMRDWCAAEMVRLGLANTVLDDRVPAHEMPAILGAASALVVTLVRSHAMELSVPSKTATYLASGRPLIVAADGETARIVAEAGAGLCVPAQDPAALAAAIRRLKALPAAERDAMGKAGRAYCEQHFEPRKLGAQLVRNLETMMDQRRATRSRGARCR